MSNNPNLSWDAICRRAGGRRKYNRMRQIQAECRLTQVVRLLAEFGFCHGYQTRIAEKLGVSRSTICRDIARLLRRHWGGKEAEERHRAQEQLQRRIRAENKLEWGRIAEEAVTGQLRPISASLADPSPCQDTSADAPPFPAPQWLAPIRSKVADVFRPHPSRQARRRHRSMRC